MEFYRIVDYKMIEDEIKAYEKMTLEEILKQIVPIIKSYDVETLARSIGVSKHTLYKYCKKGYLETREKPSFEIYIKIMRRQLE